MPIVDEVLWNEAHAVLAGNRVERAVRSKAIDPSLLAGLVFDANGERMSPTRAVKNGTRYRYYVSQSLIKRVRTAPSDVACRVPAGDLEALVENRICALLHDAAAILDVAGNRSVAARKALINRAADLARRWSRLS